MKFSRLFGLKSSDSAQANLTMPTATTIQNPQSERASNIETSPSQNDKEIKSQPTMTITHLSGWPIDRIYGYLHKSYEQEGMKDALVNSNEVFCEMNLNNIKNKILIAFREVNLQYESYRRDREARIKTMSEAGLLLTASELSTQLETIVAHQKELARLEEDFRNNRNEASIPLQSYRCGFLRGMASVALTTPIPTFQGMPIPNISGITTNTATA